MVTTNHVLAKNFVSRLCPRRSTAHGPDWTRRPCPGDCADELARLLTRVLGPLSRWLSHGRLVRQVLSSELSWSVLSKSGFKEFVVDDEGSPMWLNSISQYPLLMGVIRSDACGWCRR